jgi:hypothetical protein
MYVLLHSDSGLVGAVGALQKPQKGPRVPTEGEKPFSDQELFCDRSRPQCGEGYTKELYYPSIPYANGPIASCYRLRLRKGSKSVPNMGHGVATASLVFDIILVLTPH